MRRMVLIFGAVTVLSWLGLHTFFFGRNPSGLRNGDYEIVGADALPEESSAIMLTDDRGQTTGQSPYQRRNKAKRHTNYYQRDPHFLDVAEAQMKGLLPNPNLDGKIGEQEVPDNPIAGRRPCGKSLTYVMETSDAGMGNTLLGMWLAFGLAKKESRAFFIDDTRWYV